MCKLESWKADRSRDSSVFARFFRDRYVAKTTDFGMRLYYNEVRNEKNKLLYITIRLRRENIHDSKSDPD